MDDVGVEDKAPWGPTAVDLTNCTRSRWTRTEIEIWNPVSARWQLWLTFGEVTIRKENETHGFPGSVQARLSDGATDFEEDSAWAFRIPISGIRYAQDDCDYSCVTVYATVPIDVADANTRDGLRVPLGPYVPGELKGARMCEVCEVPHVIVPEGHYAGPPADLKLSRMVAGRRIKITLGLRPASAKDDE